MATASNAPHFDEYQFASKPHPISADTGISFDDYRGMHLEKHKAWAGQRRLPTPEWAVNNALLVKVLAVYMENRAQMKKSVGDTPTERMQNAQFRLSRHKAQRIAALDERCRHYVERKNDGAPEKEIKRLKLEIEMLDTEIRLTDDALKIPLGVIYHYYRRQRDSVETAAELGLKPPHVRQICWRLHKAAKKALAFNYDGPRWRINLLRPVRFPKSPKQYVCVVCGTIFTAKHYNNKKFCGGGCRKKANLERAKARRAGKRLRFCSVACRDVNKLAEKISMPITMIPGHGKWQPSQSGVGYENYKAFCIVIGTEPLSENAWRAAK